MNLISFIKKIKDKKYKYKVECSNCGFIRKVICAPSSGFIYPYNSASFCNNCGFNGGVVSHYNGEEIIQYTKKELKRILKENKDSMKEIEDYYSKYNIPIKFKS